MIQQITNFATIFIFSFMSWLILAGYFAISSGLPRYLFAIFHYVVAVASPALFFFLYFKYFSGVTSPFTTMIFAVVSMFIFELIVFGFFYKGDMWFLNFRDWIVPVFLVSSTIYLIGTYVVKVAS